MPHDPKTAPAPARHGSRLQLILRNLPHLLAAREAGSLHKAGAQMGIAQSALSRRISEVEAELGGTLFERLPTGIRCTPAGEDFLADAAHLLAGLDRAIRRFELNQTGEDMMLRIGFNSAAMMFPAMASALSGFRWTHPRCDLRLGAHLTEAQYLLVEKGKIDIGIAYLLRADLPLRHQILAEDRIVLALPADHPLALRPLHLGDLDDAPLIDMQRESSGLLAAQVDRRLQEAGIRPDPVMEAGSSEAALNLVAAGLGLAFINRSQSGRCPPNVVMREVRGFHLPLRNVKAIAADPDGIAMGVDIIAGFERALPRLLSDTIAIVQKAGNALTNDIDAAHGAAFPWFCDGRDACTPARDTVSCQIVQAARSDREFVDIVSLSVSQGTGQQRPGLVGGKVVLDRCGRRQRIRNSVSIADLHRPIACPAGDPVEIDHGSGVAVRIPV